MGLQTISRAMVSVCMCVMDIKNAFDTVQHSVLFRKLENKGFPYIYIRLLMVMYATQCSNAKWNGVISLTFAIKNGIKQGAVLPQPSYFASH